MTARRHPTPDLISEHLEGLLPEADRAIVEAHLSGCSECRAVRDSMLDVRLLLRRAGAETPAMPASLVDRIEAVIEDEARARTPETKTPETKTSASRTASRRHARRRRFGHRARQAFALAAGVAVLAVGGSVAVQLLSSPSPEDNQTAAGRAGGQGSDSSEAGPKAADEGAGDRSYAITAAPGALTEKGFADEVSAVVTSEAGTAGPKKPLGSNGIAGPLELCVSNAVRDEGFDTEALDSANATYQGERAVLAIIPGTEPDSVHAFVVTGCPGPATIINEADVSVDP